MFYCVLIFLLLSSACKPHPEARTATAALGIAKLKHNYHAYVSMSDEQLYIDEMQALHAELAAFDKNLVDNYTRDDLAKMQQSLSSILAVTRVLQCQVKRDGFYIIRKDDLCAIILRKLLQLSYQQIDLSKDNLDFYRQVSAGKHDKFFHAGKYRDKKFDREWHHRVLPSEMKSFFQALLADIIALTVFSMEKYQSLFPFAFQTQSWEETCRHKLGRAHRQRCAPLKQLATVKGEVYQDLAATTAALRYYSVRLNKIRQALNTILAQPKKRFDPAPVSKQAFLFVPLIQVTNMKHTEVTRQHERHELVVSESVQQALFPLLLSVHGQQLYLNPRGKFFGLAKVQHRPLTYPNDRQVTASINKLKATLVDNWLRTKEMAEQSQTWDDTKTAKMSRQVYMWLIHNELATARVLLNAPQHSKVVGHLLADHQHEDNAPQWLKIGKKVAYRLDIGFIPICILGSVLFPPAAPALAVLATAANFLWVGSATADAIVAHHRFAAVERAILSGTSQQAATGLKFLQKSRQKVSQAIFSAGVGTALSLTSVRMISGGKDQGKKFFAIDAGGAMAAEIFTGQELSLLGEFEGLSDHEEILPPE